MNALEEIGMFYEEEIPDPDNCEGDAEWTNLPSGTDKRHVSTWEDRKGDPRIRVGDHVRLCYHRKFPEHRTNSFNGEQKQVVGRVAKVVADHGHQRVSGIGYIEVKVDNFTGWWRRRDVVLQKWGAHTTIRASGKPHTVNGWVDDIQGGPDMRPKERSERQWHWEGIEPAIRGLCREALVDLCMTITKDALKPGMTLDEKKALFERTSDEDLIDGMRKRHFNFRNIKADFEEWQENRLQGILSGEIPLGRLDSTCPPADYKTVQPDFNELELRAAAAMAEQSDHWRQFSLSGRIRDFDMGPSYVNQPADKTAAMIEADKRTNGAVSRALGKGMGINAAIQGDYANLMAMAQAGKISAQTLHDALMASSKEAMDREIIRREMDRGPTPSYMEGMEYQKLRELAAASGLPFKTSEQKRDAQKHLEAHPVGMEMEKMAAERVQNSMKQHGSKVRDQMLRQMEEYYGRRVHEALGIPQHMIDGTFPKGISMGAKVKKASRCSVCDDQRLQKAHLEQVRKELASRGYPSEPIPEPVAKPFELEETITHNSRMTQGDKGGAVEARERRIHAIRAEMDTPVGIRKEIEELQAKLDKLEPKPVGTIGSPSHLNDWLKKPMGSF